MSTSHCVIRSIFSLDYQPLFGKWAHTPPLYMTVTEKLAEIEPTHSFGEGSIKNMWEVRQLRLPMVLLKYGLQQWIYKFYE